MFLAGWIKGEGYISMSAWAAWIGLNKFNKKIKRDTKLGCREGGSVPGRSRGEHDQNTLDEFLKPWENKQTNKKSLNGTDNIRAAAKTACRDNIPLLRDPSKS